MLMIFLLSSVVVFAADPPELEKKKEVYAAWARAKARLDPDPIDDAARETRQSRKFVEKVVAEYKRNGGRSDEEVASKASSLAKTTKKATKVKAVETEKRVPYVAFESAPRAMRNYDPFKRETQVMMTFRLRDSTIGHTMRLYWVDDYKDGRRSMIELRFASASRRAKYTDSRAIEALLDGAPLAFSDRADRPGGSFNRYRFDLGNGSVAEEVWIYLNSEEINKLARAAKAVELRVGGRELKFAGDELRIVKRAFEFYFAPVAKEQQLIAEWAEERRRRMLAADDAASANRVLSGFPGPTGYSDPSGYRPNAYGLGVHSDAFGRPFQWRTQQGEPVDIFPVRPDAYGLGVGMDVFGRPVHATPFGR